MFLWTKHKWILHVTDHCVAVALCGCVLSLKKQQKYYSQLESYSGYLVSQPCYIPTMGKEIRAFCESHKIKPCSWCSSNITNPGFGGKKQPNCTTESLQYHQRKKKADKTKWFHFLGGSSLQNDHNCARSHIKEPI